MQQTAMYQYDIARPINGVIKVAQDDEAVIRQELSEYVITRELRRHFSSFLDRYEASLDTPTDKIGVWISGFFGSGKSHFLKILSYLLANNTVAGRPATSYFADKFDDKLEFARLERCASVPTQTILFNIDAKGPLNKDRTAILRVFAKVFYEHLGLCGSDLKVARLEQFIARQGRTAAFRQRFAELNGGSWLECRDAFAFFEEDVVAALRDTLDITESAARAWFAAGEDNTLSIDQLVEEIRAYLDSCGPKQRLLFMVDEVGQYIGSDSELMLNLQTLVEELGARCGGRVWVMVTSQEAIDSITQISGNDFSKIQGRFNTRLSLSSSSVDEVIKRRILTKTAPAAGLLQSVYDAQAPVLKNLFSFQDAVLDLKGYAGAGDFVATFPFVPYQFRLMQNVLVQVRRHGNSGKHLSEGERSMLSGFQEAAQAVAGRDENALVPFYRFYDTLNTFLEGSVRRVIDRCQAAAENHDGLVPGDEAVLKLLYLIRYIDDVKANLETVSTLLIEDIRVDKIELRARVQAALDRLRSQNYVARNGDTYTFLTDDEQDIAREIRAVAVDGDRRRQAIGEIVFGSIFRDKRLTYGKNVFAFDRMIDDKYLVAPTAAMRLQLLTPASDLYEVGDQQLLLRSANDTVALVRLAPQYRYYELLDTAQQIRTYAKGLNLAQKPQPVQQIVGARLQQAGVYEREAAELLAQAIAEADVYVAGEKLPAHGGSAHDRLQAALQALADRVYTKLPYIRHNYADDAELLALLAGQEPSRLDGPTVGAEAVAELEQYLAMQAARHLPTSMGDVQRRFSAPPYGWLEVDIAAAVAVLILQQQVTVQVGGMTVQPGDRRMPDYLRRRTEVDKTLLSRRVAIDDALLRATRDFLRDYLGEMDIPTKEDDLIAFVLEKFEAQQQKCQQLLQQYTAPYPGKAVVEEGLRLYAELLSQRRDNTALLRRLQQLADPLLDHAEDLGEVENFFASQRPVFDAATELCGQLTAEQEYLQAAPPLLADCKRLQQILAEGRPYSQLGQLPPLCQQLRSGYLALLEQRRQAVQTTLQAAMAELHRTAGPKQAATLQAADTALTAKRQEIAAAATMTGLDALVVRIDGLRQQFLRRLLSEADAPAADTPPATNAAVTSRSALCPPARLCNAQQVEAYTEEMRQTLLELLQAHGEVQVL